MKNILKGSHLETAKHNLKIYKKELENHLEGSNNLTGIQWDRKYLFLFDRVQELEDEVKILKYYKSKGIFFDLWDR